MPEPQKGKREPSTGPAAVPPVSLASSHAEGWPWSWPVRLGFLYAGVLLPFLCFLIGYPLGPEWQSGRLEAYAGLLLLRDASLAWYPLLLYNMICMTVMVIHPVRFSGRFFVRLGIYTGVPVALQYWVLFGFAAGPGADEPANFALWVIACAIAVTVVLGFGWFLFYVRRRYGPRRLWTVVQLLLFLFLGACVVTAIVPGAPAMPLLLIMLGNLYFSTAFALVSYSAMSVMLLRHRSADRFRFSLLQLLGVFLWAACYFGAWRISFRGMLRQYAALPAAPPDCYVSAAAARGHGRLVRAQSFTTVDGRTLRANDQMRYLKAAELALAAACPRAHRLCRWTYDRIGRKLASALVHPLLADAAYLSLKPGEWVARASLAVLAPGQSERIRRLYQPTSSRRSE